MPLLFEVSEAETVISQVTSPEIKNLHALCETKDYDNLIRTAVVLPLINSFSGIWMTLKPLQGNWFCLRSSDLSPWIEGASAIGKFLTEIQSPDLHRFHSALETVRKSGRNMIVRHCIEKNGTLTFWESFIFVSRYHDLVEDNLYIIISKKFDIAAHAIRDLFETSPIAQLVILPLKNNDNAYYDAYILEANQSARSLFRAKDLPPSRLRFRDQILIFAQEDLWDKLISSAENTEEMKIYLNDTNFFLHIQKMELHWVLHLIPAEAHGA